MSQPPVTRTLLDRLCEAVLRRVRADQSQAAGQPQATGQPPGVTGEPLPPGVPGRPVPVKPAEAGAVITAALRQAAAIDATGRLPQTDDALPRVLLWTDGDSALLVELTTASTQVGDGQVTVSLPVSCDQLHDQSGVVRVAFAVGTRDRPAGLLAATGARPDGPPVVVDVWGDALTALAWRAVLDAAAGVARATGGDHDGSPLIVAGLTASTAGIEVLPQARHPFDRVLAGRAVGTP
jgi:hypothetical protein